MSFVPDAYDINPRLLSKLHHTYAEAVAARRKLYTHHPDLLVLHDRFNAAMEDPNTPMIETICIAGGNEWQLEDPELPDFNHLMTAWTRCVIFEHIPVSFTPRIRIQNFCLGEQGDILKYPKANGVTPKLLILANIPHPPSEQEAKTWKIGRTDWLGISERWNEPQIWDRTIEESGAKIAYVTGYDPTTLNPRMITSKRFKPFGSDPFFLFEQTYMEPLLSNN